SDESWFSPYPTNADVTVSGTISLPFLRMVRKSNLEGGPAQAMGSVPTLTIDKATIEAATVEAKFPPRMRGR
ncbi:MAG: hypothetical protein ACRDJI_03015, partial [Actinomycetota bacterium]